VALKRCLALLYSVTLRRLTQSHTYRAQHNTRYIAADTVETTLNHGLHTLISRLTWADIQSNINSDAECHLPWHYYPAV
jgi:hypothetical protein